MFHDTRAVQPLYLPAGLEAVVGRQHYRSHIASIDTLKEELGIKEVILPNGRTQYAASYSARTYIDNTGNTVVMRGGNKFRSEQQINEMLAQYTLYKEAMSKGNTESLIRAKTIATTYLPFRRFAQEAETRLTVIIDNLVDQGHLRYARTLAERAGFQYASFIERRTAELDAIMVKAYATKNNTKVTSITNDRAKKLVQALEEYKQAILNDEDLTNLRDKVISATMYPRQGRISENIAEGLTHAAKQRMNPRTVFDIVKTYATVLDAEQTIDKLLDHKSKQQVQQAYDIAVAHNLNAADIKALFDHLKKHDAFETELQTMYSSKTDFVSFTKVLDKYRNRGLQFDPNALIKQYWKSQTNGQGVWGWIKALFKRRPVYQPQNEPTLNIALPGLMK